MSREKDLVKNTGILSLGAFVPKLIAIMVTPILTARLTKTEFGAYDLIVTLVSLMLPAVTLEITTAAFRFLLEKKENIKETKEIVSTIYSFVMVTSIIVSIVFISLVGGGLGENKIIVFLYFIFDILLITTEQILRGLGKAFLYSLSYIVRSITNLLLILVLLGVIGECNMGLSGVLTSMMTSTGVALAVVFICGKIYIFISYKSISFNTLKGMLEYSWPMVPNNLSGWVLRLSDRLVITGALGLEINAIYAAANKLPALFQIFQSTFTLAWQENATIAVNDNDKGEYYSQMLNAVSDMLIGVMAVLLSFTPFLFRILIRGDYEEAYFQLPVLYGAMIFSCLSSVLGGIYIAYKKTISVGISTTVAAVINLVIDLLFVNVIGIWAGSISTLVSYMALFIYRLHDIQRFQTIKFNISKFLLGIIAVTGASVVFLMKSPFAVILNILLAGAITFAFDRKIIGGFIDLIKRKITKNT